MTDERALIGAVHRRAGKQRQARPLRQQPVGETAAHRQWECALDLEMARQQRTRFIEVEISPVLRVTARYQGKQVCAIWRSKLRDGLYSFLAFRIILQVVQAFKAGYEIVMIWKSDGAKVSLDESDIWEPGHSSLQSNFRYIDACLFDQEIETRKKIAFPAADIQTICEKPVGKLRVNEGRAVSFPWRTSRSPRIFLDVHLVKICLAWRVHAQSVAHS